MPEITMKQINAIGKYLDKISEIYEQNVTGGLHLEVPDKVWLKSYTDGLPVGSIEFSETHGEYVFVPYESKPPTLRDTSHIPIPPPFAS